MDQVDSLEGWVAVKNNPFVDDLLPPRLTFLVAWNGVESKIAVTCRSSSRTVSDQTDEKTRFGYFSYQELKGIHEMLCLIHPSFSTCLPALPEQPVGLMAYISSVPVPDDVEKLCHDLTEYFNLALEICKEKLLISTLFEDPNYDDYFESVGELRRQGYLEQIANSEDEMKNVTFERDNCVTMQEMENVYDVEDDAVFRLNVVLAEYFNYQIQPFLDLREVAFNKLKEAKNNLLNPNLGERVRRENVEAIAEWQAHYEQSLDSIQDIYIKYYTKTSQIYTGMCNRMNDDKTRFGKKAFDIAGTDRLFRIEENMCLEKIQLFLNSKKWCVQERDKVKQEIASLDESPAVRTEVELLENHVYRWQIRIYDEHLKIFDEEHKLNKCLLQARHHQINGRILKSSCSFYPFTTDSKGFISHSINSLGIDYLLVNSNKLEELKDVLSENQGEVIPSLSLLKYDLVFLSLRGNHVTDTADQSDLAYCITTSGTTTTPKIVSVPHRCIVSNLLALREIFTVSPEDSLFLASPLTFDPCIIELFISIISGASILIVPDYIKQIPDRLLDILYHRNSITILQATPSLLYQFKSSDLKRTLLGKNTSLRVLALGGEEFPLLSVVNQWKDKNCPVQFYNLYGITEVSCWSHCYHVTHEDFSLELSNIPIGEPLQEIKVKVTNKDGEKISHGEGVLWIGSKERICDIHNERRDINNERRDTHNERRDINNKDIIWRCTGDIVRILDSRHYIYLYRTDTQIKRHGKRLDLSTIQSCIMEVEDIKQCYVIYNENKLYVFIVSEMVNDELEMRVLSYIQNKLPLYYHPDCVKYIQSIPLTSHGKIDRKKLLEIMYKESRDINIPTTLCELTRWLRQLWQKHIMMVHQSKEDIPIEDSSYFIILGGNSLQAVYLADYIQSILHDTYPVILDYLLHQTFSHNIHCLYNIINSDKDKISTQKHNGSVIENSNPKKLKTENDVFGLKNDKDGSKIQHSNFQYFICRGNRKHQCASSALNHIRKNSPCDQHHKHDTHLVSCSECNTDSMKDFNEHSGDMKTKVKLQSLWKYDTGKCVDSSPCVSVTSDGSSVVFIGSHSHKFTALDVNSGDIIWEIYLGDRIESSPCLSYCGRFVIIGCYNGMLYVINVNNGDIKWRYQTGSHIKSSPVVDPLTSLVVFGSHDQCLYAVDVDKEECKWKCTINNGSIFSTPLIYNNTVYIGTLGGQLLAIIMDDGSIKWRLDVNKPIFSSPCYLCNSIIVASVNGCIYSVSLTGNVIWTFQTNAPIFCSPVISKCRQYKCVIIGSHDNHLYCLNPSGQLIWKFKSSSHIYSTPFVYSTSSNEFSTEFIDNCTDCVPNNSNKSSNTNENGSIESFPNELLNNGMCINNCDSHKSQTNAEQISSNNTQEVNIYSNDLKSCQCERYQDYVISASTNGDLNILSLSTGELLYTVQLPGELFSSPVIYQNKLLIGCRDNHLYCFQIEH